MYSLAATIYYCTTGQVPPQAADRLIEDTLTSPNELGANFTQDQEQALIRALALRYQDRPQSMVEFHRALYGASQI